MDCHIEIRGHHMLLMPEKAVFLPESCTLLVADVHLGKSASMRAAAIAVPGGTSASDFDRLNRALDRTRSQRLIVLGDLLHAPSGMTQPMLDLIGEWRHNRPALEVVLVNGNHDRKCKPLPPVFNIQVVPNHMQLGPFSLCHDPSECADGYILAGHIHPCVVLEGKGRQSERLPCFLFGRDRAVLPAFGSFTGCAVIRPSEQDEVYVVADRAVVPVHQTAVAPGARAGCSY